MNPADMQTRLHTMSYLCRTLLACFDDEILKDKTK